MSRPGRYGEVDASEKDGYMKKYILLGANSVIAISVFLLSSVSSCAPSDADIQTATAQAEFKFQTEIAGTLTAEPTRTSNSRL